MFNCELVEMPARHLLSIRSRTGMQGIQSAIGSSYGELGAYLAELGETPACAPFVMYYNMNPNDLDIEVGFVVSRSLPDRGPMKSRLLPAGKYAQCLFVGPYDKCSPAYEALHRWTAEKGFQPEGVAHEFYMNAPDVTPPDKLETLIMFPLVP